MILKFAASDDLKVLQEEVISECEGLLNVSTHKSIQTYDDMETFDLNIVNEKQNLSCVRKEI